MNRIAIAGLFIIFASLMACDPAMSIRQVPPEKSSAADRLAIEVSPVKEFIGSHFYGAKTKLTNLSKSSITIKGCELAARNLTYESRLGGAESYPFDLAPGASAYFGPFFQLKDSVDHVFQEPAELRVHFAIDGREELARTILRGGSHW
jgi:hypothetical protein